MTHPTFIQYQEEKLNHVYNELVKPTDRVMIIKYHTRIGVKVESGLLMKEKHDLLLKKALDEAVKERNNHRSV